MPLVELFELYIIFEVNISNIVVCLLTNLFGTDHVHMLAMVAG